MFASLNQSPQKIFLAILKLLFEVTGKSFLMKTINDFKEFKLQRKKISIVTCYDFLLAKIVDASNIDAILVGDSCSMVMHGFETTVSAEIDMMKYHVAAVKRGTTKKLIIADLPFLEHKKSRDKFFHSVDLLMKAGANAIKLEGADDNIELIRELTTSGIPVMGHLGLTPQSINQLGGYKVIGKEEKKSEKILNDAIELEEAGCFSIVLEMVPSILSKKITKKLNIPTIGIGAGVYTDGQVLVLHDLLGLNKDFHPKFIRHYCDGYNIFLNSLNSFDKDVKQKKFPSIEESY